MLTEKDFIKRIDPFVNSNASDFTISKVLELAAKKLPGILQDGG